MGEWNRIFTCVLFVLGSFSISAQPAKYRFCTVDGRGGFKKAGRYCPALEGPDSKVECVIGVDRMDCLRKISKGTADFSIFTAEDLVAAVNSGVDLLITNELRYTNEKFEYEVVAVINNRSGIASRYDLHEKKLCHPGYGYENDWTRILANFLESSVVTQSCDPNLSLTENRISSSSKFFKSACKAGPWVNDQNLDAKLKQKYPNLCRLCGSPSTCTTKDKYWGRRGPLYCLTDGMGDISWSRLDDVQSHFGIGLKSGMADPNGYNLLCPDSSIMPLNSTNPCVWVVRPWQVVGAKLSTAEGVKAIMSTLSHDSKESWKSSLLDLIETYHIQMHSLNPVENLEDFLDRATGFLSANSFSGCHPPRTIRMCTTSIVENAKCAWIREAAATYGIEPDIDCVKAENTTHCMQAVNDNAVDVVMVPPNLLRVAREDYKLKTLFYETVNEEDKYLTVAIIRKTEKSINSIADLKGKRACFPTYDGIAWNSVISKFHNLSLLNTCPFDQAIAEFFGESCVPNLPRNLPPKLSENCKLQEKTDSYNPDFVALDCLNEGFGDVAFVSANSLKSYISEVKINKKSLKEFKILCNDGEKGDECLYSWAPVGQCMTSSNHTVLWYKDALDVFMQLDNLYGKFYKTVTRPVSLFETFNGKPNVLFNGATVKIKNIPISKNTDDMSKNYESVLSNLTNCTHTSSSGNSLFTNGFSFVVLPIILCKILLS